MRTRPTTNTTERLPKRPRWVRGAVVRFASVMCLMAWLLGAAGILPGIAAVLAQADPQHQVLVTSGDGEVRLVLHHDTLQPHRHHLAARLLVAMAAPQSHPTSDHILNFGGGSPQEKATPSISAPEPVKAVAAIAATPVVALDEIWKSVSCSENAPPDIPIAACVIARSTTRQI